MVAESAGTNIAETVQAACVAVMSEIGIDMSDPSTYFPKKIDQSKKYYGVYCMGCQVACPIPLDGDFALDDPAGKSLEEVRIVRDVLKRKVEQLIQELQGERVR
jgi:arsenate reductase (thioredoxin)